MIASILTAADYRTGFYLSPHLQDFAERIQVNNMPIPHGALNQLVEQIKPLVEKIGKLTTFEITTALAFEAFRKQHVDVAVVEVGLGGRLDSTNIVDPVLSVITSLIDGSHEGIWGIRWRRSLRKKRASSRPGKPVISAPQQVECVGCVGIESSGDEQCSLTVIGRDVETRLVKHTLDGQWFEVRIPPTPLTRRGAKGH